MADLDWELCEECGTTAFRGRITGHVCWCSRCRDDFFRSDFVLEHDVYPLYRALRPDEDCNAGLAPQKPGGQLCARRARSVWR